MSDSLESAPTALAAGATTGRETLEKGSHHRYHGKSDAKELSDLDCQRMHAEDARDAKAKPEEQRDRAKGILRDPHSPADAKLNALDNSEALPHDGYLRGDLEAVSLPATAKFLLLWSRESDGQLA